MRHHHTQPFEIRTERLLLRNWRDADREPFRAMCADPRVMEFFAAPLTAEETNALIDGLNAHIERYGFGFWALQERRSGEFLGSTGLMHTPFTAHFTPCVEIGWRLARPHWGKGYASEAARASLAWGFNTLRLREIVSLAVARNTRSRKVMERIGMAQDPGGDFPHPYLPASHPLSRHVLYRICAPAPATRTETYVNEDMLR